MHTLRLLLDTTEDIDYVIDRRFRMMNRIHNQLVFYCMKALNRLHYDRAYRKARTDYGELKKQEMQAADALKKAESAGDRKQAAAMKKRLSDIQKALKEPKEIMNICIASEGLTKAGLEKYAAVMQRRVKNHLSSHQVQGEVNAVLKSVSAVLYGNGKAMHFRCLDDMSTIHGKSAENGVKYRDESYPDWKGDMIRKAHIEWCGLNIPVKFPNMNTRSAEYFDESISHRIKYCEIKRLMFPSGWRYYVILILDGDAPKKLKPGTHLTGIDPGVSSCAAVWEDGCLLDELAPDTDRYDAEIRKISRAMDRSKRATNPKNYNDDGTVRKGKKAWMFSEKYSALKRKLRTLHRKKSAYVKESHEILANRIIGVSSAVKIESMDFAALAKRSKKTERQDKPSKLADAKGNAVYKYKRRKRFGSSINQRSPGLFVMILKGKCAQYGIPIETVSARTMKASQYRHDTDSFVKSTLSERSHMIALHEVQRDLYSALVIRCSESGKPGRSEMIRLFPAFVKKSSELLSRMKRAGMSMPQVFGF